MLTVGETACPENLLIGPQPNEVRGISGYYEWQRKDTESTSMRINNMPRRAFLLLSATFSRASAPA